ncbi:DNA primase [Paenibacillus antri]|uniref:DNA primase n=1 Tax=Paenibacillus antri TaxID=2582848 RepID=A0A5R9GB58_9BACL|nr:DNA primase [Paenibacillus antri]TLS50354.1 DNA primase [Paenibacillus antri]
MRTGSIPEDVIQSVLEKTDIVELIGRTVSLARSGRGYLGLCPFHSEKTPSFNVLPEKRIFHCFGCGAGGNAIRFLMKSEGLSFPEAIRALAETTGVAYDFAPAPSEMTEEQREALRFIAANEEAAKFFHFVLGGTEQGQAGYEYLKRRGFSQKLIDEFEIGFAPPLRDSLLQFLQTKGFPPPVAERAGLIAARNDSTDYFDRFRDRVMFPIWDAAGKIVAFNGRAVGDAQPKYLHSPETTLFQKSKVLYPLHLAKASIRKQRQAVLFEGMVDVIKAREAGVENGVATLGTALTETHLAMLRRYCDSILVCYDGDRAGQAAAHKTVLLCEKAGMKCEVALLPEGKDPDEYIAAFGPDAFLANVIRNPVSSTKYKILYLKKEHTLQDDGGKLSFVRSALRIVAALESPTEREHYVKELAGETQYAFETLKQEMNEIRQKVRGQGDKNEIPWNTDMNEKGSSAPAVPALRPAYYSAERQLLAAMMYSEDAAKLVQEKLGGEFHVEAHAAIAAYLYAYYAAGREPNPSGFVGTLHDDALEALASSILLSVPQDAINEKVLEDCLTEVRKHDLELKLKQKQQQLARAERAEEFAAAAQIGIEIITLERELKQLGQRI